MPGIGQRPTKQEFLKRAGQMLARLTMGALDGNGRGSRFPPSPTNCATYFGNAVGPAAPDPSSFDEAFDREIAAHYDRARAEERAHARPISTLLPIGLPPISVQEILAARDACPIEYLRRAIDDAVEAFVSGDRAELCRILVFALESARMYRRTAAEAAQRYHNAVALIVWRLWRERTP